MPDVWLFPPPVLFTAEIAEIGLWVAETAYFVGSTLGCSFPSTICRPNSRLFATASCSLG